MADTAPTTPVQRQERGNRDSKNGETHRMHGRVHLERALKPEQVIERDDQAQMVDRLTAGIDALIAEIMAWDEKGDVNPATNREHARS